MPISPYLQQLRDKVGHTLLQIPSVAAVIHDDTGRVLLQRRTDDGHWSLPAGAIEPGETPAQALVREVWEETGLQMRPTRLLGVFSGRQGFRHTYPNGDQVEYMVAVFAYQVVGGTLGDHDEETAQLCYFAPAELPPLSIKYPRHLFYATQPSEAYFEWGEAWLQKPDGERRF